MTENLSIISVTSDVEEGYVGYRVGMSNNLSFELKINKGSKCCEVITSRSSHPLEDFIGVTIKI